jgi:rifamycin polyketide synthase module 1/2/3
VIKMVLALQHDTLPPTLHAAEPTPEVDWSAGSVRLLHEARPWPDGERPRRAGISAFGMSGTNAHVIIEQAPAAPAAPGVPAGGVPPGLWVLSARTPAALAAQARQLDAHLGMHPDLDVPATGRALRAARAQLEHRAVVIGADSEDLRGGLRRLADGQSSPWVVTGKTVSGTLAFLFSGQGSQRPDMGCELHAEYPVFADAFDNACAALDPGLRRPLRDVLDSAAGATADGGPASPAASLLDQTEFTQAALFAYEVALARLLASWGVEPDIVAGHSIGELIAAHLAGVLSLDDAAALVAARGRLMQALPGNGAMVAVGATESEVADLLGDDRAQVSIAAVNGPAAVVLSGAAEAVLALADQLAARGHRTKRLRVSHAFHSPLMEPMLAEFGRVAGRASYSSPRIPVASTVTGRLAEGDDLVTPGYWVREARAAVRFHQAVRSLEFAGARTFLEIGPADTLTAMARESLTGTSEVLPTVRRGYSESRSVRAALAGLHVRGHDIAIGPSSAYVPLPTYPFEHTRYWLETMTVPINDTLPTRQDPEPTTAAEPAEEAAPVLPRLLAGQSPAARRDELVSRIIDLAAAALGHEDTSEFDEETGFFDVGFSSLTAVEVRNKINEICGLETNAMLLFDHPTPAMLAEHLDELMFVSQPS